jgi:transposase
MAAWIGLVPRQDSTGGKQKLGPISKQGDRYLRRILVIRPIVAWRITSVAMRPQWPLALM